jgi:hypothetical protein
MIEKVQFILSLSIVLPFITGVIRYRIIDSSYHPFIWFVIVGAIMEFLPFYIYPVYGRNITVVLINLYALFEMLVLLELFYRWSLFKKNRKKFAVVMVISLAAWLLLTCIFNKPVNPNFAFRLLLSVAVIVLSVSMINKIIIAQRGLLFSNSKFLICICLIVFYTFFALGNATELSFFGSKASSYFKLDLQNIIAYPNFITNLVYTLAILWMPRKKSFINPF